MFFSLKSSPIDGGASIFFPEVFLLRPNIVKKSWKMLLAGAPFLGSWLCCFNDFDLYFKTDNYSSVLADFSSYSCRVDLKWRSSLSYTYTSVKFIRNYLRSNAWIVAYTFIIWTLMCLSWIFRVYTLIWFKSFLRQWKLVLKTLSCVQFGGLYLSFFFNYREGWVFLETSLFFFFFKVIFFKT